MLRFEPALNGRSRHVLCLGAHSDDIEIGCGGTLLKWIADQPDIAVTWVVFGAGGVRTAEAQQSAAAYLAPVREKQIHIREYRDGFFPYEGGEIKGFFEELKQSVQPDLVFTHTRHDLHQDHRLLCELTWNTFRDHVILEYEIPKYDGDLGTPNAFVHLTRDHVARKIELLQTQFATQRGKDWFDPETFRGLMRLRGMESRAAEGYAEAFYCRKVVL